MTGPSLQQELFSILIRFRQHAVVMGADIEKMYRQINVVDEHRDMQHILWREHPDQASRIFRLNIVTYRLACSPYLAIRCLHQLAEENQYAYPKASQTIREDFYMDDLCGARTVEEAQQLRDEISKILTTAGLPLRKWISNREEVLQDVDSKHDEYTICIGEDRKMLGLHWDAQKDCLKYKINVQGVNQSMSKRFILSIIAQIFDPLGLMGPAIIKAKLLLQQL